MWFDYPNGKSYFLTTLLDARRGVGDTGAWIDVLGVEGIDLVAYNFEPGDEVEIQAAWGEGPQPKHTLSETLAVFTKSGRMSFRESPRWVRYVRKRKSKDGLPVVEFVGR